jgi:aconitate hydratase
MSIFDAASAYAQEGTPLVILGGKEYGSGSSRDWAAKGTKLLGVKAVLVESFERIHRSNLVGMGVLPLQYLPGESAATYDLNGTEVIDIRGLDPLNRGETVPRVSIKATRDDGEVVEFEVRLRIDTPTEAEYFRHGGVLNFVLRQLAQN